MQSKFSRSFFSIMRVGPNPNSSGFRSGYGLGWVSECNTQSRLGLGDSKPDPTRPYAIPTYGKKGLLKFWHTDGEDDKKSLK
jgi:hypothetical protein